MGIDNISKATWEISNWLWLIQAITSIILGIYAVIWFIFRINIFAIRYRKSYKKKIYIVGEQEKFITEFDLIKKSNLVNPKNVIKQYRKPSEDLSLDHNSIVVLCLESKTTALDRISETVDCLKSIHPPIPLIIYTYWDNNCIDTKARDILANYKFFYISNFPLNLLDWLLVATTTIL